MPLCTLLGKEYLTLIKKLSLVVFCCNFSTLQQKLHDYICRGCKNMVSKKMHGFYWATLYMYKSLFHQQVTVQIK